VIWTRSVPATSDSPVFGVVRFRAFYRATKAYQSVIELLKSGQWEDALILTRSLYELDLNLSEISRCLDPEQAAKKFIRFGKFQQLRLDRQRLQDQIADERSQPQPSTQAITELEQQTAAITSTLDRNFTEFRKGNGNWQDSWSGVSAETLAQRLAQDAGAQHGQTDYFIFRLASMFTHNTPGALFLPLPLDREMMDWNEFRGALNNRGQAGLRRFLHQASVCLVDIVGMAGDAIVGYERQWFDDIALPLLRQMATASDPQVPLVMSAPEKRGLT